MNGVTLRLGEVLGRLHLVPSWVSERERASTPAQIMVPRIVYATAAILLVLFGFLMIYSSSSIMALTSEAYNNNPAYFLVRQFAFALIGLIGCVVLSHIDYHVWRDRAIQVVWLVTLAALVLTYTPLAGHDAYGATRWIGFGALTIQPAEFAKVEIVLMGARIAQAFFEDRTLDATEAAKLVVAGVGLPLLLILLQPDKGTTGVLLMTLIVMLYLSGVSGIKIVGLGVLVLTAGMLYAYFDAYSRARILTVLDPYRDEYGAGYQPIQGLLALGSGGIFGRGLGMSRQKYNYLPMAHNDFIFAIVGEELGFVGCAGLIICFGVLLWAGLKVAELAPDLWGRLIAAGSTSLLIIQLLLNLAGVTGMFPLSGKPVPFVSYGGSSVISSLLLVGTTLSVSMCSRLPETAYERRRASLRLAQDEPEQEAVPATGWAVMRRMGGAAAAATPTGIDEYGVSDVRPRSARLVRSGTVSARATSYDHLRVVEGGRSSFSTTSAASSSERSSTAPTALGQTRQATRTSRSSRSSQSIQSSQSNLGSSYARRDLGPTPAERLREARERMRRVDTER